jgi:predicted transcriptional regulator
LAQPTISQHLKELKNAGIIQGTIEGKSICYCLNADTLQILQTFFSKIITKVDKNKCC